MVCHLPANFTPKITREKKNASHQKKRKKKKEGD